MFYNQYALPPEGGFHAQQEFEFINPLKVGKKVRVTGKLVDRYIKRGREYFVAEFVAVDEDGLEIVRMKRAGALNPPPSEEQGS